VIDLTGRWLGTPRELAEFGWHVLPEDRDPGFDPVPYENQDEECLCGVDVEAVLDRHGVPFWVDDAGFIVLGDRP
jgi:hypothetical protein